MRSNKKCNYIGVIMFLFMTFLSCQNKKEDKVEQSPDIIVTSSEKAINNSIKEGLWVSMKDSLSTVEVIENTWVFNYANYKTDKDDRYEYLITKSKSDDQEDIIDGDLILTNKSDTLNYRIDYITNTHMTLIYIPNGNFHYYQRKE